MGVLNRPADYQHLRTTLSTYKCETGTKIDMALSVTDVNAVLHVDNVHHNVRQPLKRRAKGRAVGSRSTLADVKNRTVSRSLRFNKSGKVPVKSQVIPEDPLPEVQPEAAQAPTVQEIPLPPPGVTNIDEEEENPQLCHEYAPLLYHYLRQIEDSQPIRKNFLKNCHVNGKMRAVLIDWLVEVHSQFKLLPETLYMTIFLIDRYLQAEGLTVKRNRFQLLGVTAMFTATLPQEIFKGRRRGCTASSPRKVHHRAGTGRLLHGVPASLP